MKMQGGVYKRGAILSSGLSLIAKGVAFVMQILIAYYYGANSDTDIYFYLFGLSTLLGSIIQSTTTSILIPQAIYLRNNSSYEEEMGYLNAFLYSLLCIIGVIILIGGLFGVNTMKLISNFSSVDLERNIDVFYFSLLMTILYITNTFISEIFVSYKYFTSSLLMNLALNFGIILSVLFFHTVCGVSSMIKGACLVMIICLFLFIFLMKRKLKWKFGYINFRYLNKSRKAIMALLGNQCLMVFETTFPLFLLSQFQPGLITIVNYATKLIQAPLGWIQQVVAVLQIKLNELVSKHQIHEVYKLTSQISWKLFGITLCIATAIFFTRNFIADTLYGLGSMPQDSIHQLATLLGILVFSMPFTTWGLIYGKIYFANQHIKRYVTLMIIMYSTSCILHYILIIYFKETGYAIAYVLTEILIAFSLYIGIKRNVQ